MSRLIYIIFIATASAQTSPDQREFISWNEFYKIQWHDFLGEPGAEAIGDAGTVVKIKATPFIVKNKAQYDVEALFNKRKSWVRDKSQSLLEHERLHFDLAELYARKIRREIERQQTLGKNVKEINAAVQHLLEESNAADAQYDLETLHGALISKQKQWSKDVKEELKSLVAYKKKKRIIKSD